VGEINVQRGFELTAGWRIMRPVRGSTRFSALEATDFQFLFITPKALRLQSSKTFPQEIPWGQIRLCVGSKIWIRPMRVGEPDSVGTCAPTMLPWA